MFFGTFVPMVRHYWKGFLVWLITDIITAGIGWIILPFVYNKSYIKRLINDKGFLPATETDKQNLKAKGVTITKIAN